MKTLIVMCLLLAAACTRKAEPAAQPLTPQQMAPPRDNSTSSVAGVVISTVQGAVAIDSGGEKPTPVAIDRNTAVMVDGKAATASDIHEGDVVRASCRTSESGEQLAIEVVVNSKPVSDLETPPPAKAPPDAAPAPAREK